MGNIFEDDETYYTDIEEANRQIRLNIGEKNKMTERYIEAVKKKEDLQELSRWLMGYVMDLHDFRNNLMKREYLEKMPEDIKDEIVMKFPMLQGSRIQSLFRKLGLSDCDQDKLKRAIKEIKEDVTS